MCAIVAFSMMALVVGDVGLRALHIGHIPSSIELTSFSVVLITYLGVAPLQQKKGHIRVMIIYSRLSQNIQLLCDIIAWLVFLALFIIIVWQGWGMFVTSWQIKEEAINTQFPVYPIKFIYILGCVSMVIQLLIDLGRSLGRLMTNLLSQRQDTVANPE